MNILQARLKLSFARMLKADLDRGADFISNFNCNRADGSIIVKGCSEVLWRQNYEQALREAREYLGVGKGVGLEELENLCNER